MALELGIHPKPTQIADTHQAKVAPVFSAHSAPYREKRGDSQRKAQAGLPSCAYFIFL